MPILNEENQEKVSEDGQFLLHEIDSKKDTLVGLSMKVWQFVLFCFVVIAKQFSFLS